MALILNIETTTEVCSVALGKDGKLLKMLEDTQGSNHSTLLGQFIKDIFIGTNYSISNLDAVAVSMGPGSYTGLRIGVSMAKGLCYGANIPLLAIPTLKAMAHSVAEQQNEDCYYCPMIDARRMEVYTALFDQTNATVSGVEAKVIDTDSYQKILNNHKIFFFGNGSSKLIETIIHKNAVFIPEIHNSAKQLVALAENQFQKGLFENVAYFEPLYLKDFIATTPKKSILGT